MPLEFTRNLTVTATLRPGGKKSISFFVPILNPEPRIPEPFHRALPKHGKMIRCIYWSSTMFVLPMQLFC